MRGGAAPSDEEILYALYNPLPAGREADLKAEGFEKGSWLIRLPSSDLYNTRVLQIKGSKRPGEKAIIQPDWDVWAKGACTWRKRDERYLAAVRTEMTDGSQRAGSSSPHFSKHGKRFSGPGRFEVWKREMIEKKERESMEKRVLRRDELTRVEMEEMAAASSGRAMRENYIERLQGQQEEGAGAA